LLSNPPIADYLAPLCSESLAQLLLKYQPRQLRPAGFSFASPTRDWVYNMVTDNGNKTNPPAAPPTQEGTIPLSADETDIKRAPSTLPESETGVASC